MKTILTLAAVALATAVQPTFASTVNILPDGGATALLTVISVGGLMVCKNLLKK